MPKHSLRLKKQNKYIWSFLYFFEVKQIKWPIRVAWVSFLNKSKTFSFISFLQIHCLYSRRKVVFFETKNRAVHIEIAASKLFCLVILEINLKAHVWAEPSGIPPINSLALIVYKNVELSLFLSFSLAHSNFSLPVSLILFALSSCLLFLGQSFRDRKSVV